MYKIIFLATILFGMMSCEAVLLEENISNKTVVLLAPSDSVTLNGESFTFNWEPISGAETYLIQIATPTFSNAVQLVLDSIVNETQFTQALSTNNYEWRVKGQNSAYETGYSTNFFVVDTL